MAPANIYGYKYKGEKDLDWLCLNVTTGCFALAIPSPLTFLSPAVCLGGGGGCLLYDWVERVSGCDTDIVYWYEKEWWYNVLNPLAPKYIAAPRC